MQSKLRRIFIDSRLRIFSVLCLLWLVGIWNQSNWQTVVSPLLSIIIFTVLDLIFTYWKIKKLYFPFSSLVSGLLIGVLIHPSSGLLVFLSAVVFGFISKHFIKIQAKHIFNPAALGVATASLIFNSPISWWAASGSYLAAVIPVLSIYTLYKLKRLQLPLIFLAGYFIFLLSVSGLKEAVLLTFDGTVFLFSFIMLPEPMTSTISSWWRYGFSIVVLGIIILTYLTRFSVTDPLLFALILANFLGTIFNHQ